MKMNAKSRAIDKIYKRRDRYEIPDWQREDVWDRQRKQDLVDSILKDWKLPKFYFVKTGEEQYEVVDGQQRLNAIFEFYDGDLRLSDVSAKEFGGDKYENLPPKYSDAFDDFEIQYDEIEDASEEELKLFFQRLQQGLPLTSSEKLNSVHSKLRDFARKLSEHVFFKQKVAVPNTRYAYFDIVAKVAAIEIEGIDTSLRFDDLKATFEAQSSFSPASAAARRIREAFDYLDRVFPSESSLLKNRSIVQAFATLICRLISTGKASGYEKKLHKFFEYFTMNLSRQVELGQQATDVDYISFQRSVNANVRAGARSRHEVLMRKLFAFDPQIANLFDPSVIVESGLTGKIKGLGEAIPTLIGQANVSYSAKNGEDLFKATNKTTQALMHLGKPIADYQGYKTLIEDLYFLFRESVGSRLGDEWPQSFRDVNLLRTDLEHDVDHGDKSKIRSTKKKIGKAFTKYAGTISPQTLDPTRFVLVQANLLGALEADLRTIISG